MIPLICLVAAVPDGDTLTCQTGERIRIAAVNAREMHGDPCPSNRPCPAMPAPQSRAVLAKLVMGKSLSCEPVGRSWSRIVARCTVNGADVGCALLRAGAVAWWPSYAVRYRMRRCG